VQFQIHLIVNKRGLRIVGLSLILYFEV